MRTLARHREVPKFEEFADRLINAEASGWNPSNLTGHKLISGYPEGRRNPNKVFWFFKVPSPSRINAPPTKPV